MMRRFVRAVVRHATATPSEGQTLRLDPHAEPGTPGQVSAPGIRPGAPITILSWRLSHDGQTLSHWATVVMLDGENRVVGVGESAGT